MYECRGNILAITITQLIAAHISDFFSVIQMVKTRFQSDYYATVVCLK